MTNKTSMTPYAAHTLVNKVLKEVGLPLIPPQMMYNYTSGRINKGKAPLIECDSKNQVTQAGIEKWLTAYLEKKGVRVTVPDEPATIDWDGNPVVTDTEEVVESES